MARFSLVIVKCGVSAVPLSDTLSNDTTILDPLSDLSSESALRVFRGLKICVSMTNFENPKTDRSLRTYCDHGSWSTQLPVNHELWPYQMSIEQNSL